MPSIDRSHFDNPHWYENLAADARVKVQIKGERDDGIARTASERTDRDIPW